MRPLPRNALSLGLSATLHAIPLLVGLLTFSPDLQMPEIELEFTEVEMIDPDMIQGDVEEPPEEVTLPDEEPEEPSEEEPEEEPESLHGTFRLDPLRSHLFDPAFTPTLNRVQFSNEVLREVIEWMSLTRSGGKGVTSLDGAEAAPVPWAFLAWTSKV